MKAGSHASKLPIVYVAFNAVEVLICCLLTHFLYVFLLFSVRAHACRACTRLASLVN